MSTAALHASACFRASKFLYGYAKGKTRWDPAYPAVASLLGPSCLPILDVGCGIGLLAAFLRESGITSPLIGLEPDAAKVAQARDLVASRYPDLNFLVGDARKLPSFSGNLVLLDILHYMCPSDQQEVLHAVAARIAPGGYALIRTTFRDRSWRYLATLFEEAVVRSSGWIRGGRCRFPSRAEVEAPFASPPFQIRTCPLWGKTPFNSHLVEIRRPS